MGTVRFKNGFYAALGTPADDSGTLLRESFAHQIELMISAGASGLLCMGSMGRMESIRNSDYRFVAEVCASVVRNRIPLLVGVMDCSIFRVLDRIKTLKGLQIDGVVATPPFYSKVSESEMINFFNGIAMNHEYPVYIMIFRRSHSRRSHSPRSDPWLKTETLKELKLQTLTC